MSSADSSVPSQFSAVDHVHMAHTLRLAECGLYTTQPNPRVGCVLAHGDVVVGRGWHARAGEPHAEVFALREAGSQARGATAFVTLEPCAHFGRTPPCADALLAAGIARVVYACEDPNPNVDGRGARRLREAGIAVDAGLLREPARELNRGFFSRFERGRPWVRVKLATSLDGRTALHNGDSQWISSAASRADVQQWRARSSAILTGSGTVRADNPRLTVRRESAADSPSSGATLSRADIQGFSGDRIDSDVAAPLRVVLDPALTTSADAHVLDASAPTLVLHAPAARPTDARFARVELAPIADTIPGRLDLHEVLRLLAARGVNELQVEAGATLCGALFTAGLVDELLLYLAPLLLGDAARPLLELPALGQIGAARRMRLIDQRRIGDDQRSLYRCDAESGLGDKQPPAT